jgi:hypothetical protein
LRIGIVVLHENAVDRDLEPMVICELKANELPDEGRSSKLEVVHGRGGGEKRSHGKNGHTHDVRKLGAAGIEETAPSGDRQEVVEPVRNSFARVLQVGNTFS